MAGPVTMFAGEGGTQLLPSVACFPSAGTPELIVLGSPAGSGSYIDVLCAAPSAAPEGGQRKLKRRRRELVSLACTECKKKKVKCSESRPCDRCVGLNIPCRDVEQLPPVPSAHAVQPEVQEPLNLLQKPEVISAGITQMIDGLNPGRGHGAGVRSLRRFVVEIVQGQVDEGLSKDRDAHGGGSVTACSTWRPAGTSVASMQWHEVVEWLRSIDIDQDARDIVTAEKVGHRI